MTYSVSTSEGALDITAVHEKSYLTESGPFSIHALWCALKSRLRLSSTQQIQCETSHSTIPLSSLTSAKLANLREGFIHDLLLAHVGIVSHRFSWYQESEKPLLSGFFVWNGNPLDAVAFHVTQGALSSYLKPHLRSATSFRRLDWLTSGSLLPDATKHRGNVWLALLHGISEWLRIYTITLENLRTSQMVAIGPEKNDLLALTHLLRPVMTNMFLVARLCGVLADDTVLLPRAPAILSLSGIHLLAWLAHQAADTSSVCNSSYVVRFIFHRACAPFLRFLYMWVQDGTHEDPFHEFGIVVNNRFIFRKDANFWRHAVSYQEDVSQVEGRGTFVEPMLRKHSNCKVQRAAFLGLLPQNSEAAVLRCGLSLHLLRSIAPNHFLFDKVNAFPQLEFPCLDPAANRYRLQKHLSLIDKEAERAKQTWYQKVLEEESLKSATIRKAHKYNEIQSCKVELAPKTRVVGVQSEVDAHGEASTCLDGNQHCDFLTDAFLTENEVDVANCRPKSSFLASDCLEEVKTKKWRNNTERISEVDEGIRVAGDEVQPQTQRIPLAPVNARLPRQNPQPPSSTRSSTDNVDLVENVPDLGGATNCSSEEEFLLKSKTQTSDDSPSTVSDRLGLLERRIKEKIIRSRQHGGKIRVTARTKTNYLSTKSERSQNCGFMESRAEEANFTKGIRSPAGETAWQELPEQDPLPEEEIIAFSQELFGPPKSRPAPWFNSADDSFVPIGSNAVSKYLLATEGSANRKGAHHKRVPTIPSLSDLDRAINAPLQERIAIVDKCLLNHLLMDLKLFDHLRFVKSLFCHEHPVITDRLLGALFAEFSNSGKGRSIFEDKKRFQDLIPATLLNVNLESAGAESTNAFESAYGRVLFYLKRLESVQTVSSTTTGYVDSIFNTFVLVYKAPWPLNICLHDRVLAKYNTVFCLLARVKYALWTLESVFNYLRDHRRDLSPSTGVYFKASLWRHEMDQVIRALDAYFSIYAVQVNWNIFMKRLDAFEPYPINPSQYLNKLTSVKNLDELCEAHEDSVNGIIKCCLVHNDEDDSCTRRSVVGLLECVHRFQRALFILSQDNVVSADDQMSAAINRFRLHAQSLHYELRARITSNQKGTKELSHLTYILGCCQFYVTD
ncbi:unnamed protein product [Mesocestoides corti]|uniref:Gamma-tubulin complex component n=1 Tax=Mesocestoides corti TaxID=53468 RepID=A0A0R3U3V0_MESCO|nr:unnamed protein product [Mesocestoides corti]